MSSYILFLLLGLGAGATYAILGLGLVLKYRSAGVVDFAHGAVAMFIAYVFVHLRSYGKLELPVVCFRTRSADGGRPSARRLAIVDLAGLRGDPRARAVLARLPPAAGRLAADARVRVGRHDARSAGDRGPQLRHRAGRHRRRSFPTRRCRSRGVTFPSDRLYFAGIVIVIAAVLAADLPVHALRPGDARRRGERAGRRADRHLANRVAAQNWVIATVLAGVAGILIAPVAKPRPDVLHAVHRAGAGGALVGRFESFWITAIAGLLIGCAQ